MKISYKVLFAAVLSIAGTNAFAADVTGLATTNYVKGAIGSLDSTVATGNGAIDTITQADGKITATHKLLKNADIASDAAIATSKIAGLDTALAGKQTTGNLVDTTDKKGRTDKGLGKNKDGSYRQSNAGRPTMTKAKKKIQLPLTITPATKEKLTKWAEDKPRTAANYLSEYVETHLDEIMENIDKK